MTKIVRPTALTAVAMLAVSLGTADLRAQTPGPAAEDPPAAADRDPGAPTRPEENFEFRPAEGDYLKVDRRTGQVSICRENNARWRCQLLADDRDAYEDEIARLERENDDLSRRVDELETALAERDKRSDDWIGEEEEKKLDEFLDFTDKAFRRFFGMVEDLKRDFETPDRI